MSLRLSRVVRPLLSALTTVLLSSVGAAQSGADQSSPLVPLPLRDPASLLQPQPDLVLQRGSAERSLMLVVPGGLSARALGARYGVSPGAVQLLPVQGSSRLARLTLVQASVQRAPLRPDSVKNYVVRPGDTLAGIAGRFGLRVVDLLGVNLDRRSLDQVQIGDTMRVPTGARGVLVRIKPGQSALSLITGYGADLVATARANGVLPTDMSVGDELLLPGIRAEAFEQQLLARRDAEQRAAVAYAQQLKYERFLAWKKDQQRRQLVAQYERQEQYERYLAWQKSAERQAQIKAYERQAQLEAAQAAALKRQRDAAREAAARPSIAVRPASVARPVSTGTTSLAWPMRSFRLTSRFGERDISFHRQVFHGGIDLAAAYGTPIYAAAAGRVSRSGYGDYGLNVFTESGTRTLVYGHMSRTAVYAGQNVQQGQLIGYVGCTGICTGPHLHFEVRLGGQVINPLAALP